MALELLAIDLGKRSFHLFGIDSDGVILSRKVSRAKLAEAVGGLAPKVIAMYEQFRGAMATAALGHPPEESDLA